MGTTFDTYCGLSCKDCEYREKVNCKGCIASGGHPFHGKCDVADCAKERKRAFCGDCAEFPCDLLKKYSFDEKNGDNGERIKNCSVIKEKLVAEAREGLNPIAFCGFDCNHCFMGQWCGGCRSSYNCCSYGTLFEGNLCPNVDCATKRGLDGCYHCDDLTECKKGFYSKEDEHVAKAAALFIREYGPERSQEALAKVIEDEKITGKKLEQAESVEEALAMLRNHLS